MTDKIKDMVGDIADEDEECEEEHPQHKDEKGDNYIDLMTVNQGQDFQLRVKGRSMNNCEKIFNRLFSKIKKSAAPKLVKNDRAYH